MEFGALLWAHKTPPFFRSDNADWDMSFDAKEASLDQFRKSAKAALPEGLGSITPEDEHAL